MCSSTMDCRHDEYPIYELIPKFLLRVGHGHAGQ